MLSVSISGPISSTGTTDTHSHAITFRRGAALNVHRPDPSTGDPRTGADATGQSRRRSFTDVLERVCSSTRLTMTAQDNDGPGVPSGSGAPGSVPGTTTE